MRDHDPAPTDASQANGPTDRPVMVDTTIPAHIANQMHGGRYGEDWVWHDDLRGIIPPSQAREMIEEESVG